MKIRGNKPSAIGRGEGRGIVPKKSVSTIFTGELKRQEESLLDNERQALEELRERLLDAGDKLEKDPTIANLSEFRRMIGAFAKKATSMAYRIDTLQSDYGGRPLDIVTVIDREVDELYHLVMQGQRARIQIAAKISSIKGLIVKLSA
ncbi:MAG TPA: YaaR family protein [Geobacteraceae bacterium]|nr:YaaR family protein [Geobacteraceae bacterium]